MSETCLPGRGLLAPEQVAEFFGCSKKTVLNLCKRGELNHIRIGDLYRFLPEHLKHFIELNGKRNGRRK